MTSVNGCHGEKSHGFGTTREQEWAAYAVVLGHESMDKHFSWQEIKGRGLTQYKLTLKPGRDETHNRSLVSMLESIHAEIKSGGSSEPPSWNTTTSLHDIGVHVSNALRTGLAQGHHTGEVTMYSCDAGGRKALPAGEDWVSDALSELRNEGRSIELVVPGDLLRAARREIREYLDQELTRQCANRYGRCDYEPETLLHVSKLLADEKRKKACSM